MARKGLLVGVTTNKTPDSKPGAAVLPAGSARAPFATRGAPGNISRSIGDLTAKASAAKELEAKLTAGEVIVELEPNVIDPSFIADRMAVSDDEDYEALKRAIAAEGQTSPILVRPHPVARNRYQVAFGHRRLRAARDLGKSVRAVVKFLSDRELVLAQGQENSVRSDLSFIERALFAQKLIDLNYGRDVVIAALGIDKTTVSRLLSVTTRIPAAVIEAIGPAPGTGRDRWVELVGHFTSNTMPPYLEELLRDDTFGLASSDDRFKKVFDLMIRSGSAAELNSAKQGDGEDIQTWATPEGQTLVTVRRNGRNCMLKIDQRRAPEFGDFLLRQMGRLYGEYLATTSADHGGGVDNC